MTNPIDVLKRRYPTAVPFKFGDNADLSESIIALVRSGKKVATCSALRDFEKGEPMPSLGRRDIVLDWNDRPALIIETTELVQCLFSEVTEAMALAEGEDETLEGWRSGHRRYFERNGGFAPNMEIVWERFILIEDLK